MKTTASIKPLLYLTLSSFLLLACTKASEPTLEKAVNVVFFNRLTVYHGVEVHILQSDTQQIMIKTTQNKFERLDLTVKDSCLNLSAKDDSLFSYDYEPVRIEVYTPVLKSIRNSGDHTIYADNVLRFPSLTLLSDNHQSNYSNIGNFELTVDNQNISVVSNGLSNVDIKGQTNYLELGYYSGVGQFNGKELIANHAKVFHRGSNTLKVYPVTSLKGHLYSVGHLETYYRPKIVEVAQHYKGQLIFKD